MQEEKLPAWVKGNVVGMPGRDESMLSMRAHYCDDVHPCYCLTYCGSPLGRLRNPELLQRDTELARQPSSKSHSLMDGFLPIKLHI